jgi:RimJ/RimL family protein N-acetyltransferase
MDSVDGQGKINVADKTSTHQIALAPYSEDDLPLLKRANTPEMTEHLGGPESDEKIRERHQRYLETSKADQGQMLKILWGEKSEPVGMIGYWEKHWQGDLVWETGWQVFPEYQGQGIAKAATSALIDKILPDHTHQFLHAFPSVDNAPSNAICRSLGFALMGEYDFEYPPGHRMRCNDWRFDLYAAKDLL